MSADYKARPWEADGEVLEVPFLFQPIDRLWCPARCDILSS